MKTMRPFCLLFALLLSACTAFAGVQVELPAKASVEGGYIRLRDIASLRGELQAVLRAGNVFLGPAPESGMATTFERNEIQSRLMQQGFSSIELTGADKVVVTRQGEDEPKDAAAGVKTVAAEELMPELSAFGQGSVQAREQGKTAAVTPAISVSAEGGLEVKPQAQPEAERADATKLREIFGRLLEQALTARLVKQYGRDDLEAAVKVIRTDDLPEEMAGLSIESLPEQLLKGTGQIQIVLFDRSRKAVGRVGATVQVTVLVNQPHAVRALQRGDRIRPGDIVMRKAEVNWNKPVLTVAPENIGKYAMIRPVTAMGVLTADMVELASDVKKGELIEADTVGQGFRIYEQVRALEDGRVGETVRVQSVADSKSSYLARVIAPGKVEVAGLQGGK